MIASARQRRAFGLALVVLAGLALRLGPLPRVFTVAFVNFQGDAWYHMRRVDWQIANYPHSLTVDPYAGGQYVPIPPVFDLVLSTIAGVATGFADPGSRAADTVAALAPALLGGLVALPAFGLARLLFGEAAGWLAAALTVLLPGPFLIRSLVGVTDHHVVEVLWSSLTLYAVARSCRQFSDTGRPRRAREWAPVALAGAALGAYLLSWSGGAFLVLSLGAWAALQYARDLAADADTGPTAWSLAPMAATALVLVLAFQDRGLLRYGSQVASLQGLLVSIVLLEMLCALGRRVRWRGPRILIAGALVVLCAVGLRALVAAGNVADITADAWRVLSGGGSPLVSETRPLFGVPGERSWRPVVGIFGASPLGLLALPALLWTGLRGGRRERLLIAVWTVITLVATLGTSRFGYYLAPNLALLLGWILAWLLERLGRAAAAVAVALLVANVPALGNCLAVDEGMPVGWHQALSWLRRASPEPFGDPSFYLARYLAPPPAPSSRVLAWWDYGYWILRVARRVPVANPTQAGAAEAGRVLTSGDDTDAVPLLDGLRVSHVIVNDEVVFRRGAGPDLIGKYATLVGWAGKPVGEYVTALFERRADGQLAPVWAFLPSYYRSLAVHLYLYEGRAVAAEETWVLPYELRDTGDGRRIAEVSGARAFPGLAQAEAYRASLPGPALIAGRDPLRTCVPLAARPRFRLDYESEDRDLGLAGRPRVRVFEYVAAAADSASGSTSRNVPVRP